ncbi:hypothetical protein V9T40_013916 [Parthenolecanium corni]|uniref:Ubiquitin carboxyl-terminal hydrolase n=1 Tax=Parthenolecanium corni TaxID=536013 RepID=A0AAN9TBT4_9HEMI
MPVYKVKVKWGKELFNNVEVNTDDIPLVFKAQLFDLTGVQPERQKVMLKGTVLKDSDWGNVKLTDGTMILMMGSKEEDVAKEPEVKPVFVEDMNEAELASSLDLPAGLHNLGNTCYMNATIQCLKSVPELREALSGFKEGLNLQSGDISQSIVASIRDLYSGMEKGPAKHPIILLQMLHTAFPRFAERGTGGTYVQQDANECWTELIRMLQQKLPSVASSENVAKYKSFIDQYFGGKFDVEWKCDECADEPVNKTSEDFLQLSCFISQDVKYMINGLKNKMQENITKNSSVLGRDAVFTKTAKISRLPAYLTIQFVRFFYKENNKVNAKILKDIKFPLDFDAYDLCSPELQEKMTPIRNKFKELEEQQVADAMNVDKAKSKPTDPKEEKAFKIEPYSFPDDVGSNNSGYYELQAVLTHKGRSSSSGHYVAWVKHKENSWIKCDDSDVTPVSIEEILKLSGGGDWHCAYVLLYGPKLLKIPETKG